MVAPLEEPVPEENEKSQFLESQAVPLVDPKSLDPELKNEWLTENSFDTDEYVSSGEEERNTWKNRLIDLAIQPELGIAKVFTYPFDFLKLAMVGEGLTDIDELEEVYKKNGVPFDRDNYLRNVANASELIPTQELLEKGITAFTGVDLEPRSDIGRIIRNGFTVATFGKGGLARRFTAGLLSQVAGEGLKQAGVPELPAEIIGDVAGLTASTMSKVPRILSGGAAELEETAAKHGLPFWEGIAEESGKSPKNIKISAKNGERLRETLDLSVNEAIDRIATDKLPAKTLVESGINIDTLITDVYSEIAELSAASNKRISSNNSVTAINRSIKQFKDKAPSPSNAEKTAISVLETERNALTGSREKEAAILEKRIANAKPLIIEGTEQILINGETLPIDQAEKLVVALRNQPRKPIEISLDQGIEQIRNWNQNLKSIYKSPEFSGREDAVRFLYEDLKTSMRETIRQSEPEIAKKLLAADKLFADRAKLYQFEGLLSSYIKDGSIETRRLAKNLSGRDGKRFERLIGKDGVADLQKIAKFQNAAEKNVLKFAEKQGSDAVLRGFGKLAPFLYAVKGTGSKLSLITASMVPYVRGRLISRPATRETYRLLMEETSKGNIQAAAVKFGELEAQIADEYGSVDDFMREGLDELNIWSVGIEDLEDNS